MHLRLIYFDFPFWRAEAARIALHLGGVPFEDVRPSHAEFLAMKRSGELPYGQLPVLDVDGTRIAQSLAILRFCGKKSGLYPEDDVQAAQVDELLDCACQITALLNASMRSKDAEEKAVLRAKLASGSLPRWLGFLENRLDGEGEFFVGQRLSIADLVIWRLVGWLTSGVLDGIPRDLLAPHPRLAAQNETIDQIPAVRACMARYDRPEK
jgi:glutathione S-transferase